jgi:sugar transferase (PEP-CTERM/EpsH1 system associated)
VRILFLTHRLPYAPNRGDRVRAYHMLRSLKTWANVDLLSLVHDEDEASHARDLQSLASTVTIVRVPRARNTLRSLLALPTSRPTTHTMLDAPDLAPAVGKIITEHRPELALAYCSGMARVALEPSLRAIPLVLDMVDVDSAKWAGLAATTAPPRSWVYAREARLLERFEDIAARHAFTTLVVTDKERQTLAAIAPGARIEVVQNGVDTASFRPPDDPASAPVVIFCGVMNYAPNEEGAIWLARSVWPFVRERRPDALLQLVGSHPTRAIHALADEQAGISVIGRVPDVQPYLWGAAVAAAPLRTARGVQNKVLEAVAAGLPTVVTPVVLEGLPADVLPACSVADGAEAFADAIVTLLSLAPAERRQRASQVDLTALSWERRIERLRPILEAAARSPRRVT